MPNDRAESAYRVRVETATVARNRPHPKHEANRDEARFGAACYPMSFTKGLEHNEHTGLVAKAADFEVFRTAIDNGFAEPFTTHVPVPRSQLSKTVKRRQWEAPTAGIVYDLEGPDAQAVTMPPAPELGSDELNFEMAEVYELALLRDEPFAAFQKGGPASAKLDAAIGRLKDLNFAAQNFPGTRGRKTKLEYQFDIQDAFRGSSPGVLDGPYLSQFLLIGTRGDPAHGLIGYGAQVVDQRVLQAEDEDDYMMLWDDWLFVQRGYDARPPSPVSGQKIETGADGKPATRFICTPRDLATYVHVDALYQAYLNACLILLGQGAPFDPAFDLLSGMGDGVLETPTSQDYVDYNAGGFALWGGPHILSLVTEVATRGLKAVRFQKFNVHLRLRPEALASRMQCYKEITEAHPSLCEDFVKMHDDLTDVLQAVRTHNKALAGTETELLPMAFEEGSPMHPTYGAGHATVAGACVTMLKAFFDTSAVFVKVIDPDGKKSAHFWNKSQIQEALKTEGTRIKAGAYVPHCDGTPGQSEIKFECYGEFKLTGPKGKKKAVYHKNDEYPGGHPPCPLTLEGELNKLAANISIGRNMAGVHYYSDYYDSVRMGEEISLGILEEQALCYPTDRFVVSVPTFDGDAVRIGRR